MLLEDSDGDISVLRVFKHSSGGQEDFAQMLVELARDLDAQLQELKPDGVVVRAPDQPPRNVRRINFGGTRDRAMVDATCLIASRNFTRETVIANGLEIGRACGSDKSTVDQEGEALTETAYREAAAAALAALARLR